MTKKVFIGVLAALMLFGFTACEQKVPEIPHDVTVLGATIKSGSLYYYTGDKFDSSRYTVEVLFSDTTTKDINGAGVLSVEGDTVDGTEAVKLTYAGYAESIGNVYAVSADSITLDTSKAKLSYVDTTADGTITDAGLVVTAKYGDNQTKVLSADQYSASLKKAADNKSGVVTVTTTDNAASATYNVTLTEEEPSDDPYEITIDKATKLEATWIGGELYTDTAAAEVAKTTNWKVVAKDDKNGSLEIKEFTITTAASMAKADEYQVQITKAVSSTKNIFVMSKVTVLDTISGIANMNGGNFVIKVSADQDYTLGATDIAAFEAQIYAVCNNVEIKGTGFHIIPESLSKTFFPRGSFDTNGYEVKYSFTWDGNNNTKEYENKVKVFFQEGV